MDIQHMGSSTRKGDGIMQNVNAIDKHGHTALMQAAKAGELELVKDLLHRGAALDARSEKGKTALHYASANGHVEVANVLIENGAEIDARDLEWRTPLMLAAIYGCNHTVQALVQAGADPAMKTKAGNTAMLYAENNNHPLALAIIKKSLRAKEVNA